MKTRIVTGVKFVLIISWTMLMLWNYFWSFPLINLPEILQNGFMLIVLLLFFCALGKRILRMASIKFDFFGEELSFSFGIGTGVVIFLLFGLATLGILYEFVIVGLILFLFILVYSDAKAICLKTYTILRSFRSRNWSLIELIFLFSLTLAGIATFFAATTPPFFYDALTYHLAVPYKYFLHHGFHFLPHHYYSNFPANIGMLFLVGISFSGSMLASKASSLALRSYDRSCGLCVCKTTLGKNNCANFCSHHILCDGNSDSLYDVVLMIGELHHMSDLPTALRKSLMLLKPGGFLVVNEPQPANMIFQALRYVRSKMDRSYSVDQIQLDAEALKHLFRESGLINIMCSPQGFFSTPFAEVIIRPQLLTNMIGRAACKIDSLWERNLSGVMKKIAWNIVVSG